MVGFGLVLTVIVGQSALADETWSLARPGGPAVGQARMTCSANDLGRLHLFDRYGGELGSAAVEGCPRLFSPLPLDAVGGGAALIVAGNDKVISLLAAVTPGGGMVLPVDLQDVVVRAAETDGEGRVLSITLGRDTVDGKGGSKVCRLTDVSSSLACIDGF
ncbi:hypothetical protein [Zavarzinia sp.]|uniref:hypothetical protein n=1 Tax=Zavarzinia sp. TaxID=2027920 RepID=UPI003BB6F2BF